MGYRLGVDLGTTFTAAAVDDGTGPTMLGLGNRALTVPSVVYLADDGTFLFGEAADRRAAAEPGRSAREFKRRIGDTVPILLDGQPFSPQALSAKLLAWVVTVATERHGGPPDQVVLSYPANWGGYKRELLDQLVNLADLPTGQGPALTCTEPEAAATQYAARAALTAGDTVAVYDLGGGTFDICVLEKQDAGFTILGSPDGVEHLGGIDFDEAVFQHVIGLLGDRIADLDLDEPHTIVLLNRLRRECVAAKEALSSDVDTTVDVELGALSTSLRITRSEFDRLIGGSVRDTLDATHRALRSAGVEAPDLATVVLVGGSSRIPLVSHLLQSEFGVRTAMDTHPKHDIALGAVRYQPPASGAEPPAAAPEVTDWPTRKRAHSASEPAPVAASPPAPAPRAEPPVWPGPTPARRPRRRTGVYLVLAAALAVVGVVAAFVLGHRPSDPELTWNATDRAGTTAVVGRGTTVTTSVLGIPLPGELAVRARGRFDVPQNLTLFAAGPVDAYDGTTSMGVLAREGDPWWRPVATVPGGFMVLALLFAFAYAESQLRSLRRGSGDKPRPGELAALVGIGLTLGLCCSLLAWMTGVVLTWPLVLTSLVCFAAAFGMLAFGLASRRAGPA